MITAEEYLKFKRKTCKEHLGKHCVMCDFYGECNVMANVSDGAIDELLRRIGGAKNV
jgi:hypothetical protein